MKKSYLIDIPNSLGSPELELLLSTAQILIDKKENVEIVTCLGGKNYTCSKNIFSQRSICMTCKSKRLNSFKKLKGKFDLTYTPELKNYDEFEGKFDLKNRITINSSKIDGVDIGAATLSSYLDISRDANLDGLIARRTLKKLIKTTINLYFYFNKKLNKKHHIIIYNGRNSEYRPLLRIANKKKIEISNLEWSGDGEKNIGIRNFKNHLVQDIDNMNKVIKNHWKNSSKENKCDHYFHYIKAGRVVNDKASYVLKQNKDLLPDEWDQSKRNIVYFTSSMDEYFALGGEFDKTIYKDQNASLKKIIGSLKEINDKNIYFWVRCHPNLSNVFWKYNSDTFKFHDPKNRDFVIKPTSKISSYKMLLNCEKILNYNSRTGIEAVYWKKPSIVLGRSVFEKLNCIYKPKNHKETMKFILDKNLTPKSKLGPIKWASYWVEGGYTQKYFSGSLKDGFKFRNQYLKFGMVNKFIYYFGKITQHYFYNYVLNYKFSFLRKLK